MSNERPLRVIQWGTGNAGTPALRAIIRDPRFELVGVHAHSPEKIGRDAAELCGLDEKTGVIATDDIDALLASGADCVSYMVQGETRIGKTIDELRRALAAGCNVVNTSLVFLVYPPFIPAGLREPLEAACAEGGSTLFTSGLDPGWSGDVMPIALACACEAVDSIRVTEMMDYSTYADPEFTGAFFGFGRPLDDDARLFSPGAISGGWGGMVHMVADALGWKIDELREEHERLPAARDVRDRDGHDRARNVRRRALRGPGNRQRAAGRHGRARQPPCAPMSARTGPGSPVSGRATGSR